jgi:hypothetical protein
LKKFWLTASDWVRRRRLPFLIFLLVVELASYGLMLPTLGLYWDDWQVFFLYRLRGLAAFTPYFAYDRPFSAWTYLISLPLLQTNLLAWHLFTLILRYLTALGFWSAFRGLWPRERWADWIALVVLVYPVFLQQPIAVAYSQHWTCFALYAAGLSATIWSQRKPQHRWLVLPALAVSALQLFTMEYFAGLELLRGVVLLLMAAETEPTWRRRIIHTALRWLPYLLVLAVFTVWRFFLVDFPAGETPNQPVLLTALGTDPFGRLLRLATYILQDGAHLLFTAWARGFGPETFNLSDRFNLAALLIGLSLAILTAWQLRGPSSETEGSRIPAGKLALLGLTAVLLGVFPVWASERQITVGAYSDRFALAALPGFGLLLCAFLLWLSPRTRVHAVLLAVLVGLSGNIHLRNANDYRWHWLRQQRFFWQLAWRAPDLLPGTPLAADGELISRSSIYSASFALNLLYGADRPQPSYQPEVWFFSLGRLYRDDMATYLDGVTLRDSIRNVAFNAPSTDAIVLDYRPGEDNCLHILRPEDAGDPLLPAYARQAAATSNLDRILPQSSAPFYRAAIFGSEPPHDWCYLYQKAELARQQDDWAGVLALAEEAAARGYHPQRSESSTAMEWRAFIEAYARAGQIETAVELTRQALERQPDYRAGMCRLWQQPVLESNESQEMIESLECAKN